MNRSMPGLPVHHQLLEFTQIHVHQVGDAIQPSHPLSSRSPPALNPSQHQGLFQWVNSSHEVAKVLEFQLQHHQPVKWIQKTSSCTTIHTLSFSFTSNSFYLYIYIFLLFEQSEIMYMNKIILNYLSVPGHTYCSLMAYHSIYPPAIPNILIYF